MNEITYAAMPMQKTQSGIPFTASARVYLNGTDDYRFVIMPTSPYDTAHVSVVMLTRQVEGHWKAVTLIASTYGDMLDSMLTELAQLIPPF
jgi:hypothetical protein